MLGLLAGSKGFFFGRPRQAFGVTWIVFFGCSFRLVKA